jgi:hypothetical protein
MGDDVDDKKALRFRVIDLFCEIIHDDGGINKILTMANDDRIFAEESVTNRRLADALKRDCFRSYHS